MSYSKLSCDIKKVDKYHQGISSLNCSPFQNPVVLGINPITIYMPPKQAISRKAFLTLLGALLFGGFIYLWDQIIRKQVSLSSSRSIRKISLPIPRGITFYDGFYICSSGRSLTAYSTTCTHAGCLLKQELDGKIICACHGSIFEASTGKPLKGPAIKPLRQLSCELDQKKSAWIISG